MILYKWIWQIIDCYRVVFLATLIIYRTALYDDDYNNMCYESMNMGTESNPQDRETPTQEENEAIIYDLARCFQATQTQVYQ